MHLPCDLPFLKFEFVSQSKSAKLHCPLRGVRGVFRSGQLRVAICRNVRALEHCVSGQPTFFLVSQKRKSRLAPETASGTCRTLSQIAREEKTIPYVFKSVFSEPLLSIVLSLKSECVDIKSKKSFVLKRLIFWRHFRIIIVIFLVIVERSDLLEC